MFSPLCSGLYNILAAYPNKSATAVCTLAFSPSAHADPVLFTGECVGRIVPPIPGRGFGWDSIFVPERSNVPFSQMELAEKNAVSHRGNAVRQFANWIGRNQDALLARQERKGSVLGHQGLTFSLRPKKKNVAKEM
jgi:inosine/xanthosine triphosphate pyrophosphatase family protein